MTDRAARRGNTIRIGIRPEKRRYPLDKDEIFTIPIEINVTCLLDDQKRFKKTSRRLIFKINFNMKRNGEWNLSQILTNSNFFQPIPISVDRTGLSHDFFRFSHSSSSVLDRVEAGYLSLLFLSTVGSLAQKRSSVPLLAHNGGISKAWRGREGVARRKITLRRVPFVVADCGST